MQDAVLRRPGEENTRIPHFMYIDEFPDFVNKETETCFTLFRKYRCAMIIAIQNLSQLERVKSMKFYKQVVLSNCKTVLIFGDTNKEDSEYWSKAFGYKLKAKSLLYDILRHLHIEQYVPQNMSKYYHGIKMAIEYINDNYSTEQISIEHLAKMCSITTTHFSRTFKTIYSTTPVKYINNLRLEKACALLTHTNLSINEISDQCGFSDSSYFSKTFKSAYGQSPANYRNSK